MYAARFALLFALVTAPLTASAGPAPPDVEIACHDAVGIPGGIASVEVTMLRQEDAMVVGTQNDLTFDDEVLSIQRGDCLINPQIGPGSTFDKELQQNVLGDPPRVRGIIVALDNVQPIPAGLLYTCPFRVAADAAEGSYAITNDNLVASTATGVRLSVEGESCNVVVAAATATPTPTPGCRTNEDCPDGQVCVDGECVTTTPTVTSTPTVRSSTATSTATATPIGFCEDNEDCPPGQVCIDNMCVTVTPTPQCREDMDCPSGQVCVDGMCVTSTPTATPTATPTGRKKGGGDGCSCEIDPGAPPYQASDALAVLLPALVLLLRWRTRRAAR